MGVTADQRLCKQPNEKRKFGMEFGKLMSLSTGETITSIDSVTSETIDGSTSDLTLSGTAIIDGLGTNSRISLWIESGTSGKTYRIEISVTTSDGQILEGDGLLHVTDR